MLNRLFSYLHRFKQSEVKNVINKNKNYSKIKTQTISWKVSSKSIEMKTSEVSYRFGKHRTSITLNWVKLRVKCFSTGDGYTNKVLHDSIQETTTNRWTRIVNKVQKKRKPKTNRTLSKSWFVVAGNFIIYNKTCIQLTVQIILIRFRTTEPNNCKNIFILLIFLT